MSADTPDFLKQIEAISVRVSECRLLEVEHAVRESKAKADLAELVLDHMRSEFKSGESATELPKIKPGGLS